MISIKTFYANTMLILDSFHKVLNKLTLLQTKSYFRMITPVSFNFFYCIGTWDPCAMRVIRQYIKKGEEML